MKQQIKLVKIAGWKPISGTDIYMRRILFIFFTVMVMAWGSNLKAQIDTDRMTIIGRNALYFEDYVLAIQYFNQIIRVKPYLAEPYFYRAVGKYNLEDFKGALDDCDKAIERNPYLVDAYNLRGILYQQIEDPESSIENFKRGLEIDAQNMNLLINLGIAHIQLEEYDKAIDVYTQVLDKSPNHVAAYLNRGLARFSAEDTTGAANDFTRAIEANPYVPDGYINRAMIRYHEGDFEDALADIEEALELKPEESSLYMNRAIVRYQLDDLKGTLEDFNKFVDMEPRNAMGYNNRGILRAEIGDLDGAIDDLSRVLALREEEDLPTVYYRGLLYQEKGEFKKALSDFNVVADAHPEFAPVYMNRAEVKQALGQEESAQLDYNTAMKIQMDRSDRIDDEGSQQLASADDQRDDEEREEEEQERKETREEDDRNIQNYNKIAVLEDFGAEQPEQLTGTSLRGKIQNRNIMVDLQSPFGLTFFPGDTLVHRMRYYESDVEDLDKAFAFDRSLEIANATTEVERSDSKALFETISQIEQKLENAGNDNERVELYMERGLLYMGAMNLNNAIDDFTRVTELDPDYYLAYFARAFARYKMVQTISEMETDEDIPEPSQLNLSASPVDDEAEENLNSQTILDYNLVIEDLEKTLELEPEFEFAWFNLGYMNNLLRNFEEANEYYSKALELNPDFAEAWFNRGLVRIFLQQGADGTMDLSKAGELGIFEAYSVIKRYGSYSVDPPPVEEEVNDE
ncbi:MAG: tetratricopeptide repeat protein [Marinilabilia sp.]